MKIDSTTTIQALLLLLKKNTKAITVLGLALALFGTFPAPPLLGQAGPNAAVEQEEYDEEKIADALKEFLADDQKQLFTYKSKGRKDPFTPFISEEVVQEEIKKAEQKLTGMQRFEPGQLTVVGIVFSDKGPVAMVQDSTGKGYVIEKGTKIGRAGVVENIQANQVVIKQQLYYGKKTQQKRYKTVNMVLKKEGEK